MASQYASPFDDLLNTGRRQFDELAGTPPEQVDPNAASAAATTPAAPRTEPHTHIGTVVEGTAAGIAFKLSIK